MAVTGPDFIALQVRDVPRAADFYEKRLGLRRAANSPPNAVVPQPGAGVALWLGCDDTQGLHGDLAAAGVSIAVAPFDGPFGRTLAFVDLDGYTVTIHQLA